MHFSSNDSTQGHLSLTLILVRGTAFILFHLSHCYNINWSAEHAAQHLDRHLGGYIYVVGYYTLVETLT